MSDKMTPEQIADMVNKKHGRNSIMRASDALGLKKIMVSTGCVVLDILLGGGLLEGRMHQLRGNFSGSKTSLLLSMAYTFLKVHPKAIFIFVDAEGTSDVDFLVQKGWDADMLKRTYFVTASDGEEYCDIMVDVAKNAEKCFMALDSVDALTPKDEIESDQEDAKVALGARMMNRFVRRVVSVMKDDLDSLDPRITFVYISQLREKVGGMAFADNDTCWGGKGKEFSASTIIKLSRTKSQKNSHGRVDWSEYKAELKKIKGPGQHEVCTYRLYKSSRQGQKIGTIDNGLGLITWALEFGVIKAKASTLYYGDLKLGIKGAAAEMLKDDPALFKTVFDEALHCRHRDYGMNDPGRFQINHVYDQQSGFGSVAEPKAKKKPARRTRAPKKRATKGKL